MITCSVGCVAETLGATWRKCANAHGRKGVYNYNYIVWILILCPTLPLVAFRQSGRRRRTAEAYFNDTRVVVNRARRTVDLLDGKPRRQTAK